MPHVSFYKLVNFGGLQNFYQLLTSLGSPRKLPWVSYKFIWVFLERNSLVFGIPGYYIGKVIFVVFLVYIDIFLWGLLVLCGL